MKKSTERNRRSDVIVNFHELGNWESRGRSNVKSLVSILFAQAHKIHTCACMVVHAQDLRHVHAC